jgi:tight adherence protein B
MELIAGLVLVGVSVMGLVYGTADWFWKKITTKIAEEHAAINATFEAVYEENTSPLFLARLRYLGPVIACVAVTWLTGKVVFALLIALIAYVAPKVTIDRIVRRRRERLEQQASDVMLALSSSLKSGLTIEQAVDDIATNMNAPASQEFGLIRQRIESGQLPAAAFRYADARLQIPRLTLIFQTIVVSLERGGRLASLMDRLAVATKEIERVEERVKTETSGIRMSSNIMLVMPIVICGLLYLVEPNQVLILFETLVGNVILVIALMLEVGAYFIIQRLIDLDV